LVVVPAQSTVELLANVLGAPPTVHASAVSIATNGAIVTASAAAYLRDIRPVRLIVISNPNSKQCGCAGAPASDRGGAHARFDVRQPNHRREFQTWTEAQRGLDSNAARTICASLMQIGHMSQARRSIEPSSVIPRCAGT
jgi:hypothetical protein